jgi:ABC-type microcin C transport system duplicated ATPase subunit YejF
MNIIPFNWRPSEEQIDEFIRIENQVMMTSNEEEHRKVLEKLTLPELRIVLNAFDYLSRGPRQNFRLIKRLCEERFGAEA